MQIALTRPRWIWFIFSPGKYQSLSNNVCYESIKVHWAWKTPFWKKANKSYEGDYFLASNHTISWLISIHQYIFMNLVIFQSHLFPPFLLKFLCMYWFYFVGLRAVIVDVGWFVLFLCWLFVTLRYICLSYRNLVIGFFEWADHEMPIYAKRIIDQLTVTELEKLVENHFV